MTSGEYLDHGWGAPVHDDDDHHEEFVVRDSRSPAIIEQSRGDSPNGLFETEFTSMTIESYPWVIDQDTEGPSK